ncbi:MAG: type II toxin-antitoxin system VapC family toxin [Meiothermus sp.]|uniref:type II toxin-antitoxin system VapC family toxin n=1 Tax=Meiothermus sp. TaxID=1955249 RepID=UPI0025DA3BD1|nr:type II toxin-antitoxin system VapC family toxin [Meiothermus sp.]MCS7069789.1 type II toxin-antitoxin system VapC family toxin [Meiothermus sp.]MDW8426866.1 type II toxin-antitoxin system VapC family toxin [Meiothermus sp.]
MKRYLLDTHAWVYFLADPIQLPRGLETLLEGARAEQALFVSAISAWEVAVLARKGRLAFTSGVRHWLEDALRVPGIEVVPLDAYIALEADGLPLPHPDPADRFIVATALRLGAVLVSRDEKLQGLSELQTLWKPGA